MIGIQDIASYIPEQRISNYTKKEKFGIDDKFIEEKIGIKHVALKNNDSETSSLCIRAFENLRHNTGLKIDDIETIAVVTQNPDMNIPHTSAILHGMLGLSESCSCFDISLGCSGFVHGLSIIQSFMLSNNIKKGVFFTADPYSKIVITEDKNTSLLFGDAATATLISDMPLYKSGIFTFGTSGREYNELRCDNGKLYMNGRAVFNFSVRYIPIDIKKLLEKNQIPIENINRFVFHQGSKYMIDTIISRMGLDKNRVPFDICDYGNTVSSSIPIILEKEIKNPNNKYIVISGFGVGLSWSSGLLIRTHQGK